MGKHTPPLKAENHTCSLRRDSLRIVVLGPGEAQPQDLQKRQQIADRLRKCGYTSVMLGEELLGDSDVPLHFSLLSEIRGIDLLLVLNTGPAPLAELATISSDYRARQITRVWSRREYTQGRRSTPSDVLKMFDHLLFSNEEFESCELVESMVDTANRFCMSKAQREGRLTGLGLLPPG